MLTKRTCRRFCCAHKIIKLADAWKLHETCYWTSTRTHYTQLEPFREPFHFKSVVSLFLFSLVPGSLPFLPILSVNKAPVLHWGILFGLELSVSVLRFLNKRPIVMCRHFWLPSFNEKWCTLLFCIYIPLQIHICWEDRILSSICQSTVICYYNLGVPKQKPVVKAIWVGRLVSGLGGGFLITNESFFRGAHPFVEM